MRVLNVHTLEVEDYDLEEDRTFPGYATLSHVWTQQEVSFLDMTSGRSNVSQRKPEGCRKIIGSCEKARRDGMSFLWVDTCCIDKSSSSELSEAINSMFRWYRNSTICYAYLADVPSNEDPASEGSRFRRSMWFSRGWTLQELLAPYEVVFLAQDWREIGNKHTLGQTVSEITGIDTKALKDGTWDHVSIAGRLSWASMRHTTRVEDQAYCLMGLFDVNMPLIYGEGKKAFYRLQLEIMNESDDESIFVWRDDWKSIAPVFISSSSLPPLPPRDLKPPEKSHSLGLLATSPQQFWDSGDLSGFSRVSDGKAIFHVEKGCIRLTAHTIPFLQKDLLNPEGPLVVNSELRSSEGKTLHISISSLGDPRWSEIVFVVLQWGDSKGRIVIPLRDMGQGEFSRVWTSDFPLLRTSANSSLTPAKTFLVRARKTVQPKEPSDNLILTDAWPVWISSLPTDGTGYCLSHTIPADFVPEGANTVSHHIAVCVREQIGVVTPIVLFFQHEMPEEHPPFAIRADRIGPHGSSVYHLRCRVGPLAMDWEQIEDQTDHQSDWVGAGNTTFPLADGRLLVFRFRKTPDHLDDVVNISIENILPWRTEEKWPLPPRLPVAFALDEARYNTTWRIMQEVERIRVASWGTSDTPPASEEALEMLTYHINDLNLNYVPDIDEEAYCGDYPSPDGADDYIWENHEVRAPDTENQESSVPTAAESSKADV